MKGTKEATFGLFARVLNNAQSSQCADFFSGGGSSWECCTKTVHSWSKIARFGISTRISLFFAGELCVLASDVKKAKPCEKLFYVTWRLYRLASLNLNEIIWNSLNSWDCEQRAPMLHYTFWQAAACWPLTRHSFLLSSSTAFMFSLQIAPTGPGSGNGIKHHT